MSGGTLQLGLDLNLPSRLRFATFHAAGNPAAVAACRALAAPGVHGGIVYLHGPSAGGKTHLLYATLAQARADGARTLAIDCAAAHAPPAADDIPAGLDLIGIDNLQAAAGHPAWEAALFRLLIHGTHATAWLLTARGPPGSLPIRLPDLRSRLQLATAYRLAPPDDTGLAAALGLHAADRGLEIGEEVRHWLLRRHPRDLGALLSLLDRLDRAALASQRRLTLAFVRSQLGDT